MTVVCFGPDRAFAYNTDIGRGIPFGSTPVGWNLTVELEAPDDANNKLQEVMDIVMTEQRLEKTENVRHAVILHTAIGAVLVLVALGGQTLTNDSVKNKTVYLWRAWTIGSSLMVMTVSTPRAPFWVVKVQPSMMIWSIPVQCIGV